MDPELLSMDDTPAEARELLDAAEQEIDRLRDVARRQADDIRARAERACADIEEAAEEQIRARQLELLGRLKPLQDRHAREGQLDEALAIRDHVRGLKAQLLQARPDPGSLGEDLPDVGIELLYELMGSTDGAVWGTDYYTADSHLATVAVHAGVLREGEGGVVRVTAVDTSNIRFVGTDRNGVRSMPFATWPTGFQITKA
jgi:multidrug efflux pump subunit AcrA (membrane-fusion protein)